ncbi:MAG: FAD-binding protein [Candidatus Tectimicrobiota bacterium]|nr:MAG: FAD-binding protein [Candidatus Tectomicrobia bacterium]
MDKARLVSELAAIVPAPIVTAPEELLVYECDGNTLDKAQPDVVVFPTTSEQVAAIVRLANQYQVPFVARGAGTGLSGGALALHGGIIIEMCRMNKIWEVDYVNQRAVVGPGLVNLHLSLAVADAGYFYAPDPSSQGSCTIGGNVAENSGGPHTLKYGVTTNHVLGLEVVLPNGDLVHFGGATLDTPGYDLTGLFVGSEGTFGIATKVTVQLLRKPEAVKTILAAFATVADASNAVSGIIGAGLIPGALEMMDHLTIQAVEAFTGAGLPLDAGAVLLIELDGIAEGMEEDAARVVAICQQHGCRQVRVAKDEAERALLWKGRKQAFGAMGRLSPNYYTHDGVIPRTRLPEALERIQAIGKKYGLRIANVFHAGDGNLHPLVLYDERNPEEVTRVMQAGEEILRTCVELGGALTGEHGIGMEKRDCMPWLFTEDDLEIMHRVRQVFNPHQLCNPGKVSTPARQVPLWRGDP